MRAYKVTVTATATNICPVDNLNRPVWLQIDGNVTVFVGGSNVTAADGFPVVKHAAPMAFTLGVGDGLWGICAAGQTETVRILTVDAD